MLLILEIGLQGRTAHLSPGYFLIPTQTWAPESLTYVDEVPLHSSPSLFVSARHERYEPRPSGG